MNKIQRLSPNPFEVIRNSDTNEIVIEGYAAIFNSLSKLIAENGKVFYETIKPGAFTKALENLPTAAFDCVATFNHQKSTMLARTKSGTLSLTQDDYGLKFSFVLPDTTAGRDVKVMLDRGDLTQCSFIGTYRPDAVVWARDEKGNHVRTVTEFVLLKDVALVIDAAYDATSFGEVVRELQEIEEQEQKAQEEEALRSLEPFKEVLENLKLKN